MVWGKREIVEAQKNGRIKITPFVENAIRGSSVNLRLGSEFRFLKKSSKPIDLSKGYETNFKKHSELVVLSGKEKLILKPGQMVLGLTLEKIKLPNNVCGFIEGRSGLARLGLLVHVSSELIHPGANNKQVLELVNLGPSSLELRPGTEVCQIVLDDVKSSSSLVHSFQKQDSL
ncbi:MAG: dCTP deaminase [Candidatus Micrarchaeota archaeon]